MLIKFSICDGRHIVADEESTLLYRMHTVVCAFYRLCSPRRHRSLVFVVIIADEYEREMKNRASECKRRNEKTD